MMCRSCCFFFLCLDFEVSIKRQCSALESNHCAKFAANSVHQLPLHISISIHLFCCRTFVIVTNLLGLTEHGLLVRHKHTATTFSVYFIAILSHSIAGIVWHLQNGKWMSQATSNDADTVNGDADEMKSNRLPNATLNKIQHTMN